MNIAQQSWWKIKSLQGHDRLWLPAGRALGDTLVDQSLYAVQLHASHNGSDINRLIQRRSHAQRTHSVTNLANQRFSDAFLHQQSRARATHLALVEPYSIHKAFYCAIEIGVFEDNEGGLASQFQRKPLMAGRSCAANSAPHFRGPGKGNLVHVRMLDQGFAR